MVLFLFIKIDLLGCVRSIVCNQLFTGYMKYWTTSNRLSILIVGVLLLPMASAGQPSEDSSDHPSNHKAIAVSADHPQYWEYQNEEILLLGGSKEDNLFQADSLTQHLKLLQSVGGNYVRNTMSSRDEGNVWPFRKLANGKYDLNKWNEEYWQRFDTFLRETSKRNIIVQIEVWATFDFYRAPWQQNPFNPKNNVNYSAEKTKLSTEIPTHPTWRENNFFWSIPQAENNTSLLWFQQQYVDKLLSYALKYSNVLYCMDNETSVTSEWGKFWAQYIQKVALEKGKQVQTTEMWDPWDLNHVLHRETFDHPETYSFVDISQNNHNSGDEHWQNGIKQIERLKQIEALRPVTNIKIYGNDGGKHQTTQNAIESFCRNIFLGSSSARFHRPTSGQGLNATAQHVIQSLRSLTTKMDFFNGAPHNELLTERQSNEAYCRAKPESEYAVYFTGEGSVVLSLPQQEQQSWSVQWLNILDSNWSKKDTISPNDSGNIELDTPAKGHWIAFIRNEPPN